MFFFWNNPARKNRNSNAYLVNNYLLYDRFTTTRTAGNVNGTAAEPVGGNRVVTDTNSRATISGGAFQVASATDSAGDPGMWYGILTRALGQTLIVSVTPATTTSRAEFGWDAGQSGGLSDSIFFSTSGVLAVKNGGGAITAGEYSAAPHTVYVVQRAAGNLYFIKGGIYTYPTLLFTGLTGNANMYPSYASSTVAHGAYSFDNLRVPKRKFIPPPIQSDGMSATTTDGAGNAEANGAVGNAYTNVGTWGVASGARSCSALSGGLGFSYLPCSSSNILMDVAVTRGAGVAGLVARYVDAQNYLIAYHDGTNACLDKVVAGSTTSLIAAAATYSAGAVLRLSLNNTKARLYYAGLAVGAEATTPAAGSLNHGLYTTGILTDGNSFDNLIIWAKGNENQYAGLDVL